MPAITPAQIRAARGLLDWSQQELAEAAGLQRPAVNRIEKGTADPRASTLQRIEEALLAAGVETVPPIDGKGDGVRFAKLSPQA